MGSRQRDDPQALGSPRAVPLPLQNARLDIPAQARRPDCTREATGTRRRARSPTLATRSRRAERAAPNGVVLVSWMEEPRRVTSPSGAGHRAGRDRVVQGGVTPSLSRVLPAV